MDNRLINSTEDRKGHRRIVFKEFYSLLVKHGSEPFVWRNDNERHRGDGGMPDFTTLVEPNLAKKRTKGSDLSFGFDTASGLDSMLTSRGVFVKNPQIDVAKLALSLLDNGLHASRYDKRTTVNFQNKHEDVRNITVNPQNHVVVLCLVNIRVLESEQFQLGFCFRLSHYNGLGGAR